MAIENYGLREAAISAVDEVITIYLHTGDPGANGTSNRVASGTLGSITIPAGATSGTTGWTIHATEGRAEVASDINFGNANNAVKGVSWYSLFKGTNFFARRLLASSMDIANGALVTLSGSSIVISFTSTDV